MTIADQHVAPQPIIDRPHMPDGYLLESSLAGFLPWEHVRQRMTESLNYWISTARLDGRPHATPIWGMWLDDTLYFDGSPETTRNRNIAANPAISVHLESAEDVVIMEGEAFEIKAPDLELRERLSRAYTAKYTAESYAPGPETWEHGGLYIFHTHKVLAWTSFTKDPTRWTFERQSTTR